MHQRGLYIDVCCFRDSQVLLAEGECSNAFLFYVPKLRYDDQTSLNGGHRRYPSPVFFSENQNAPRAQRLFMATATKFLLLDCSNMKYRKNDIALLLLVSKVSVLILSIIVWHQQLQRTHVIVGSALIRNSNNVS